MSANLDVDDVEPAEPPVKCTREDCDERFWRKISMEIHWANEHEIPESFVELDDV